MFEKRLREKRIADLQRDWFSMAAMRLIAAICD
jgi:hypothetical protein